MTSLLESAGLEIQKNASLSHFTTFQLGGSAKGFVQCNTPFELEKTIQYFNERSEQFILIGGGSNLVVSDSDLDCYVIRYCSNKPLIQKDKTALIVSGSTNLDSLSLFAAQNSLTGLECVTGIPGTVGGAVVGNAGAFGKQVGDIVEYVDIIDINGNKKRLKQDELEFRYRDSILKYSGDIILSVKFQLEAGNKQALFYDRQEILDIRSSKHPNIQKNPCAGSFFRNIEPTSKAGRRQAAGWFLEEAGAKNLKYGGAEIYNKHANIIVKGKDCTAQDVYALSQRMAQCVKSKFDIDLVREVRFVGDFFGKPSNVKSMIW